MVVFYTLSLFVIVFVPALIWLLFFLREDSHPEPRKLIFHAFAFGGIISMPTLALQIIFQNLAFAFSMNVLTLIIGLALIEEILKFFAAYSSTKNNPDFDEPIDAMIYMVIAGLGFATVENLFIVSGQLDISTGSIVENLGILSLRFVGATLLHVLSSASLGYFWGKGIQAGNAKKFLVRGVIIATTIHSIFNYLVLEFQDVSLLYPSIFLVFAAFFVLNDFEKLKSKSVV